MSSRYEEIMKNKSYLPYKLNHLKDWMVEKAVEELNETDENRGPAIAELRRLMERDSALRDCWKDDNYLLQFLRARKFNVKKAHQLLQSLYAVKKEYSEIFTEEFDSEVFRSFLDIGLAGFLPYRNDDGCPVLMLSISNWNPDRHSVQTVFTVLAFLILMCVEDPATQVCGIHIVLDVKGISFKHIRCFTPRYIQLLSKALSNTVPVRFKGIHIFNESFIFQYIYAVIKVFLSDKIKNRIHFHGDNGKHLQKFISKAILTPKYGGDNIFYDEVEWSRKETLSYEERYAELLQRGR